MVTGNMDLSKNHDDDYDYYYFVDIFRLVCSETFQLCKFIEKFHLNWKGVDIVII